MCKTFIFQEIDDEMVNSIVQVTSAMLFDIFPFIVVFNRGMRIRNTGMGLMRIMPNLIGEKVNMKFIMMRPQVGFKWEEVCGFQLHKRDKTTILFLVVLDL